jgi:protein TonB
MSNRPTQENKKKRDVTIISLLVSLTLHVAIILFVIHKPKQDKPVKQLKRIKLSFKTKSKEKKKKDQAADQIKNRVKAATKKRVQIVATEKSNELDQPVNTRFLSEKNQKVDRQTVSKNVGAFKGAGKGKMSGIEQPKKSQVQKKLKKKIAAKSAKKKSKKAKFKSQKKKLSFSDLALSAQNADVQKVEKPKDIVAQDALGLKNGIEGQTGLSRSSDYVEDIPLGDMTKLNTKEYKFYGFYSRIRQKLEQYWGITLDEKVKKIYSSGRRMPASTTKITNLLINIDRNGNIRNVTVKGSSGFRELDEAAIESFNKAGPFPNPPTGMLRNGVAEIEWSFVVKG